MKKSQLWTTASAHLSLETPAVAGSWTHTSTGGYVTVSGSMISLKDSADDGKFVSVHYAYDGHSLCGSFANKLGYGKTITAAEMTDVNNDKIRRSHWLRPAEYGSWEF
ncbi:hypothetical protein [Trueperella pyogenes]